jgi:hypothetical protein
MLALGSAPEANIGKYLTAKTVLVKHFSWYVLLVHGSTQILAPRCDEK